jgi:hypothetical protein
VIDIRAALTPERFRPVPNYGNVRKPKQVFGKLNQSDKMRRNGSIQVASGFAYFGDWTAKAISEQHLYLDGVAVFRL